MTSGMTNRIRIDGNWHDIGDLIDYPLSRIHSIDYPDGHVWQIRFGSIGFEGSTILELTPTQALQLQAVCAGIDDLFMTQEGK